MISHIYIIESCLLAQLINSTKYSDLTAWVMTIEIDQEDAPFFNYCSSSLFDSEDQVL